MIHKNIKAFSILICDDVFYYKTFKLRINILYILNLPPYNFETDPIASSVLIFLDSLSLLFCCGSRFFSFLRKLSPTKSTNLLNVYVFIQTRGVVCVWCVCACAKRSRPSPLCLLTSWAEFWTQQAVLFACGRRARQTRVRIHSTFYFVSNCRVIAYIG